MVRNQRDNTGTGPVFALTNHTEDVDINCNSATNDELSDLIGTVIKELIRQGIFIGSVAAA